MAQTIDYTFSLISPFSYLGAEAFFDMAEGKGAPITYRLVSIGDIFGETGGLPPAKRHPSRQAYRMEDLARWQVRRGKAAMNLKPKFFPANDAKAAAMVNALIADGQDPRALILALHRLVWEEDGDIADAATLRGLAEALGLDAASLLAAASQPEIEGRRAAHTAQAVAAGIFGVPWYRVGGENFWGQDNLEHMATKL